MLRNHPNWYWPSLIPIASGLCWLQAGASHGFGILLALFPGLVHAGAGVGFLLWPGDRRMPQALAASCFIGVLLALVAFPLYGWQWGLALSLLNIACYFVAGYAALFHEPVQADLEPPHVTFSMAAKVALDDALLGYFVLTARQPGAAQLRAMAEECHQLRDLYRKGDLRSFHPAPQLPKDLLIRPRSILGLRYEHLRCESAYEPVVTTPGAERWQAQERNRRCHAWMLRHPGAPRPWLVCIHGYRMGMPLLDFRLFDPRWLHMKLGLNLLLPVLPLHGPRRAGLRSGDGYMDGDLSNLLHAETQAMLDIRSLIRWLRESEQASTVGVLGYSLGGYNAALLAALEEDLACVIAGIPMADAISTLWHHMPLLQLRQLISLGLVEDSVREALRAISPLNAPPLTARRYIFAGLADRLIPSAQVQLLARHWGVTDVAWYQGTHLSFRGNGAVSALIRRGLCEGGLIAESAKLGLHPA